MTGAGPCSALAISQAVCLWDEGAACTQSAPCMTLSARLRLQGRARGLPQTHQLGRRPGRAVPSELGAGGSCRAFAPYTLRLAGQGPGGSERGLRAETGSQVPPAGHGHPGGGHLSLGARPSLWEAHALVTVCPSDCCVAGLGSLPVSPPSDVPSPCPPPPRPKPLFLPLSTGEV